MAVSRSTVLKTEISISDLFHPVHIVDLDTPIHVCQQFGCYNVRFTINDQNDTCSRTSVPDALQTNRAEIVFPSPQLPPEGKQLRNDERCHHLWGML